VHSIVFEVSFFFLCLILFFLGVLLNVAVAQTRQYYFENTLLNWTNAQSVCRRVFTDLATIENTADIYAVLNTTFNFTGEFLTVDLYINI